MIYQDFRYALRLLAKKPGFTMLTTMVITAIILEIKLVGTTEVLVAALVPHQQLVLDLLVQAAKAVKSNNKSNPIQVSCIRYK